FRSQPGTLVRNLGHPHRWLAEVGTDAALVTSAGAALWLAAAWLGIGFLTVAARRLPGRAGILAGRVSAALVPRLVLRLVAGSAGLGVLLAPLPAAAAGSPAPNTATSVPAPVPAPVWPSNTPPPSPSPATPAPPPAVPAP